MNFRTDLAIELAQQLQDTVSQDYQTWDIISGGAGGLRVNPFGRQGR